MRVGLALIVLVLDVFAIVSILGARRGADRRLGWLAAVVLLPLVGALAWFASGRHARAGLERNGGHNGGYHGTGRR